MSLYHLKKVLNKPYHKIDPRINYKKREVSTLARKTSEDFEKTKQRLLEVGLSFFEEKGYNATGIQEIATKAEISKGSFYSYFSSKEDFGVAVIRFYTDNSLKSWNAMLVEAMAKDDAFIALSKTFIQITENYKNSLTKKGCLLGNLAAEISEASEECRIELKGSIKQYNEILTKHIAIGQSQGSVRNDIPSERLAELVWDCWQGSLLRMKIENSVEPVTNDLELLFSGILQAKQT